MIDSGQNTPRRFVFYSFILLVCLVLAIGFYRLQVLESNIYQKKSWENSVKIITQVPVRGNIYDRNEQLIVDNRPSFSLYLIPSQTNAYTIRFLSERFQLDEKEIRQKLKHAGPFQPVKVVRHVDLVNLTQIQENILDLNGLEWRTEPKRHYLHSKSFAHIIGTLGEIDEREIETFPKLEPGDVIGKKGIEKALDDYLRGEKGYKYVKVDALGRTVEDITSEKNMAPRPGSDVYLTLDARLQEYADSLFEGRSGALVAIETSSGEIISMVSNPDYDLNWFSESVEPEIWQKLISDSLHPLYDRACQSSYPPGSTFKLVAALAALNEGVITPRWTAYCPGYYKIGRKTVLCWKADGHGKLDLLGAIKNSCNVYFYQLGLRIGIDLWSKYSNLFLFGKKTGIELTNENAGLVPSTAYYDRVYGEGNWTRGMLANLAIGQGELLVTPLQMAQFTMIVANSGVYYTPHLTAKIVNRQTGAVKEINKLQQKIEGVAPEVYEVIKSGMREVVHGGTGWRAGIIGVSVAGKTGTAQNPHGEDHAWFIGYAPVSEPRIAIAVLVENGGSGGGVAAPIAGDYLRRYFYYRGEFDYKKERRILQEIWARQKAQKDSLKQLQEGLEN